jgi:hypothetical protein
MTRILLGTAYCPDPSLVKTKRFYPNDSSQSKSLRGSAQAPPQLIAKFDAPTATGF